ncbi:MAG: hypothetical protein ABIL06_13200 [Pseudomonadota bacterium]|uniref:Putative methyltransferase n=1 Tax=viral metagenome TaxID=1070528 RepID=A0A6M3ITP8_9ZZZZ
MINVGMVVPNKDDATSFYRAWGAFSEMRKRLRVDVNLVELPIVSWGTVIDMDVVFVQRPFNEDHIKIIQMVKSACVPVWVDWDDALWLIGKDNPCHHIYDGCGKTIKEIAANVAIVTVSTQRLADELPIDAVVVRNELPKRFRDVFSEPRRKKVKDPVRIVWRGGSTHQGDWMTHLPAVIDSCKGKNVEFIMLGDAPFFVIEGLLGAGIKVGSVANAYIEQFLTTVVCNDIILGDIMFVPLRDTVFNRCKSNIAQLEGTAGGMICVCPEWEEWDGPFTYAKSTDVYSALSDAITAVSCDSVSSFVKPLQEKYCRAVADEQRWGILGGLE